MTVVISRWLSAALINLALFTPAVAIDESFGDELTDNTNPVIDQPDTAPVPVQGESQVTGQINMYDDPLTFYTLRRITLKQLNIDANANQPDAVKDPFQAINRKIFNFNNKLDKYLLLPVARGYKNHVPQPVRTGVSNFFSNLGEPWNAVNHLLQGKPKSSYKSLGRFTINTVSSLGLADPAARLGIEKEDEDFGLTLGAWGIKSGPFLMLPALGPSTLRDGAGRIFDVYGRPQHYMDQNSLYWTSGALEAINLRAGFVGVEDLVQGDQYALLRDLYLQRRQYLVSASHPDRAIDSSFGDEDADFGDEDFGDTGLDSQSNSSEELNVEPISPDTSTHETQESDFDNTPADGQTTNTSTDTVEHDFGNEPDDANTQTEPPVASGAQDSDIF
ncbi:VacJ family lipoprotein [Alkanindiges sp. WGS2144]|uniref:MlaA family lipoprotein n=1 Tax=Alkanindiges sp. WGS2144 TaxID=3366808 RepID=UPI0037523BDE